MAPAPTRNAAIIIRGVTRSQDPKLGCRPIVEAQIQTKLLCMAPVARAQTASGIPRVESKCTRSACAANAGAGRCFRRSLQDSKDGVK